jgi:hypothetical protein
MNVVRATTIKELLLSIAFASLRRATRLPPVASLRRRIHPPYLSAQPGLPE